MKDKSLLFFKSSTEVKILVLCLKALLETQSIVKRWGSEDSLVRPKEQKSAVTSVAKRPQPLQTDTAVQKFSEQSINFVFGMKELPRVKCVSPKVTSVSMCLFTGIKRSNVTRENHWRNTKTQQGCTRDTSENTKLIN